MNQRIVYFDLETGGLDAKHPDIQIAAIATEGTVEVDVFEAKIQFDERAADPEALKINSYDAKLWQKEAQPERVVVAAFAAFLNKHAALERIAKGSGRPYKIARLAGHNVLSFDAPRLSALFKRHGAFLPADTFRPLDTLQLASWSAVRLGIEPTNFRLSTLCETFALSSVGAHDALADVRMSFGLARILFERLAVAASRPG
jgi:DNA polymerase III epsilon subunit-like protein